jgi:hypothetical protein
MAASSTDDASTLRRAAPSNAALVRYVIHVSVDGLRSGAVTTLGARHAPHFYRMRVEGAFTDNARTDYDYTVTLPDHACELTSRPVLGANGHGLTINSDNGGTLASIHGSYVAGVFDVVHDHGLRTGMYASKSKFDLFERTWSEANGAPDTVGPDNGTDKIDVYVNDANTITLNGNFIANMNAQPQRYAFIHYADPDAVGHSYGWNSPQYYDSVVMIDGLIGELFELVDSDTALAGKTAIVLTADHGGWGTDHGDPTLPADYTVPFYAWGPGIPAGADLYWLNESTRLDPGTGRPTYDDTPQPIRNGETANLSLDLLGLGPVPGSSIDAAQDLAVSLPGGPAALPIVSITDPADGRLFVFPEAVTIDVAADAGTGSITSVELFDDYVKVGEDAESPYSWTLSGLSVGPHRLTARANRSDGISNTAGVGIEITESTSVPDGHSFRAVPPRIVPNPADRATRIEFSIEKRGVVNLGIYDLLGRRLQTVFCGELDEGVYELPVDAGRFAPGLYFLMLRSGSDVRTQKLMVLR